MTLNPAARWDESQVLAPDGPDEMGRELAGGPAAVRDTLEQLAPAVPRLRQLLEGSERIVLVGTGASLSVARTATRLWALPARASIAVRESSTFLFGHADGATFRSGDAAIFISKSGTSPETLAAARLARRAAAAVIAVTADGDSPLALDATHVIRTPIGAEHGAATKSALSAAAALLLLGGVLPGSSNGVADGLIARLDAVIADWPAVPPQGRQLAGAANTWFVGFGAGLGLASAAALAWHEKVRRQAVATSPSEFRHGCIEAARRGDVIVAIDVDDPDPGRAAYVALLASELGRLGAVTIPIAIPGGGPGERALAALLRVQQLARATAHASGTLQDGFQVLRAIVLPARIDIS